MALPDKTGLEIKEISPSAYEEKRLRALKSLERQLLDDNSTYTKKLVGQRYDYEESLVQAQVQLKLQGELKIQKLQADFDKTQDKKEKKKLQKRIDATKSFLSAVSKLEKAEEKKREKEKETAEAKKILSMTTKERKEAGITKEEIKAAEKTYNASVDLSNVLSKAFDSLVKVIDKQVEEVASYQSKWDTRLLGSGKQFENSGLGGLFGLGKQGISSKLAGIVGVSPFIQTAKVFQNVDKLVDKGIAFNIEQRAFLQTISEKIATTFDAANGTLLQLIRVQQADTTAARLGMEADLTAYLNNMFQSTEYLSDVFDSVSASLYEATSQMSSTLGVEFEYQIQKWLGSLYSVGMSSATVDNIAKALGMLGSGNIAGLESSGMQNLIVMAASKTDKSYAELLLKGLNPENTNELLESMVTYLKDIASRDNNVVKAQLASIFGVTMSDLQAITNLATSTASVAGTDLDYAGALATLMDRANTMWQRTSTGEMMTNAWENLQYTISTGIASNPALFALWKVSNALTDVVEGIAIPAISVMGNMVDLNTNIASLMKVGAIGGGLLSGIGNMIAGTLGGSAGGFSGSGMLKALGITNNNITTITRGSGLGTRASGATVSESAVMVGNTSSSDVYETSMTGASEQKAGIMAEAKEEDTSITMDIIDGHIVDIYTLLQRVTQGIDVLYVQNKNVGGLT